MSIPRRQFVAAFLLALYVAGGFAHAQFTTVLNIPPDPNIGDSQSIGSNTQLNLSNGGAIGSFFNAGLSNGSSTNIEVNVSGGTVGSSFRANGGSEINISGGRTGPFLRANSGSIVNLSGGWADIGWRALSGGVFNWSGGTMGNLFTAASGSALNIYGGEFRLNGTPIAGTGTDGSTVAFDVPSNSTLSGVLSDGTPFAFWTGSFVTDIIINGTVTLHTTALPAIGPPVVTVTGNSNLLGVRDGQTLVVGNGGTIMENFNAGRGSSVVVLPGGQVGNNLEAVAATVLVEGDVGTVRAFDGSTFNVTSGEIDMIHATGGSVVNIAGGDAIGGGGTPIFENALLNISGGLHPFELFLRDTTLNISGGSQGLTPGLPRVSAYGNTTLHLYGSQFQINGVPIAGVVAGEPFIVTQRDVDLSGVFVDGRPFLYELNESDIGGEDYIPGGTVTVTLVDKLPGDYNGDEVVDGADYVAWQKTLGAVVANGDGADGNFNGVVDEIDHAVWKSHFERALRGDYNGDKVVDAADYVVWRKTLGALIANGDGADGNFNGVVDEADYAVWKSHFELATGGSGNSSHLAVPEPGLVSQLIGLFAIGALVRRRIGR